MDATQSGPCRDSLDGDVITPGDDGYDEARTLFNAMIDRRPAAIAQCATSTTSWPRRGRRATPAIALAVRAGGHSVAGHVAVDDGLVIDVRAAEGDRGRSRGARRRAPARGVTWARVRRRDAGARAGDDRRPRLDHRRRRAHARRRLGLARALVRAGLRQPDRRRARDRGGRVVRASDERERRAVLGAARRRRQLRRRHRARVPAAPGRPDRLRRPRRVRPGGRARGRRARSATSTRTAAPTRPGSGSATSPRRPRSSSRRSGRASSSRSSAACGTARSRRASARCGRCSTSPSRSSTSSARSRTSSSSR